MGDDAIRDRDDLFDRAWSALGQHSNPRVRPLTGSRSSSGVYLVEQPDRTLVVKATSASSDRSLTHRELAFYRELADHVAVRTPSLLEWAVTDDVTAMVFTAHRPSGPVIEWEESRWLALARQLAALHTSPLPDQTSRAWRHEPWILQTLADPPAERAAAFWSSAQGFDMIAGLLADPSPLITALAAEPSRFLHGDCHGDNFLTDDADLVWADWQSTGFGPPAADLAFLWFRAFSDGANPPREAMLAEYVTALRHHDQPIRDFVPFQRSLVAFELGTLLFGWPEFAQLHSQDEQLRIGNRLTEVAEMWNSE